MTLNSASGPVPASMVERMARALHATDAKRSDIVPASMLWKFGQKAYREYALAALREMREPTEAMVEALVGDVSAQVGADMFLASWAGDRTIRAAIDAEIAAYEAGR